MAIKNLKLTIKTPTDYTAQEVTFTQVSANNDYLRIPRRYPFIDIANLTHLRNIGFFRHEVGASGAPEVSTQYGSNATDTEGKLGYQLPQTEKLFLLVESVAAGQGVTDTEFDALTIEGSKEYGIPDLTVKIPYGAGKVCVLDTFDFGLFVKGHAGEDGVMIKVLDKNVKVALVARAV